MLVLTRKLGQEIRLGENVSIRVLKFGRNRVTLGISAPDSVKILRGELDVIPTGEVVFVPAELIEGQKEKRYLTTEEALANGAPF